MTDDHDSSTNLDGLGEGTNERSPFATPRFVRLVRAHVGRRLSPRRLGLAIVLGLGAVWGGSVAGLKATDAVSHWVGEQPEHQIEFGSIDLIPGPPPFITSGVAGILETVRQEARYGPSLSVLNTNLEALRVDLSRNPWIAKAGPVRASYRHLAVEVDYRTPLAVVVFDNDQNEAIVIDRAAVELPIMRKQFEWAEERQQYRVLGDSKCLIEIRKVGCPVPLRVGLPYKSMDPEIPDHKVVEAAQLAQFLADRAGTLTPGGQPTPDFRRITLEHSRIVSGSGQIKQVEWFLLLDSGGHYLTWNSAPGCEQGEEPTAAEKWTMLARFIDTHGPLTKSMRGKEFLRFTSKQAELVAPSSNTAQPQTKTRQRR